MDELKAQALTYFNKGYELQMQGQLEAAVAAYTKSIDLSPTAEAYTFRGWTYSFMGRLDEAIAECHKAIAADPDFGNPYNDIGAYLVQQGKLDAAVPWFEQALRAPRYESYCFPHMNLGRVWEAKGQWMRALECYRAALEANPEYEAAGRARLRLLARMN